MFSAGNAIGSGYTSESVTCHWGTPSNDLAVMGVNYPGAITVSPLDAVASGSTRGGTTLKTQPFSTTSPNEIIVAGMMSSACAPAPAPGSGYTMEINAKPYNCAGPLAAVEDQGVSTPQAGAAASMSVPSGTYADIIVATFKLWPASGPGLVQVQNNIDMTTTAHTSFSVPITTNPGNLLVAFVRESSNSTDNFTMTDSAGQTWTQTPSGYKNESSTGPRIGMFYIANSAAVTSVTAHFTTSGGVIKPGIMVMEISGAATSSVADGSVNNASGGTATKIGRAHV